VVDSIISLVSTGPSINQIGRGLWAELMDRRSLHGTHAVSAIPSLVGFGCVSCVRAKGTPHAKRLADQDPIFITTLRQVIAFEGQAAAAAAGAWIDRKLERAPDEQSNGGGELEHTHTQHKQHPTVFLQAPAAWPAATAATPGV
jgi:hypothetical protein